MTDRVFTPISGSSSRTGADGALAGNTTRRKSAITSFKAATAKRLGVKGAASEDEEDDGEDAVANERIATIETCLRERRDLNVVSLEQMARVAQFEKDVERRLKRKKLRWYIIDPQSTQMQIWDLITAVALVFTAFARVRLASQRVHGHGQRFMTFARDRSQRHRASDEPLHNFLGGLHVLQSYGGLIQHVGPPPQDPS